MLLPLWSSACRVGAIVAFCVASLFFVVQRCCMQHTAAVQAVRVRALQALGSDSRP